ncbi:proto-oncogene serine/threonine-protein kinase mos-like [Lutzomyia longipalpis]|uniref:proto-oncogene serine/threonine-protein kinase mos-like n=1 Tax=Lutzomyia longipalpis TaxID=7200 RepID=UPI002483ADC4|nr:proto-oncogene serine/threonine-protein kinase mos-like [Lutzomyia longipalpis]
MNELKPPHVGRSSQCVDTPERINFLSSNCTAAPRRIDVLGRGGFGIVLKATYKGKCVAVKVVQMKHEYCCRSLEKEKNILCAKHPNIIRIFKVVTDTTHGLVIMERISGENLHVILNVIHLSTVHGIEILSQVASGLIYCHRQGVTHGDLKPQNIMITLMENNRRYVAKLCDFGCSSRVEENPKREMCRGTIRYMAPEALNGAPLTPKVDIFAFGVIMWQIMSRKIPYEDIHSNEIIAYRVVHDGLRPDVCQGEFLKIPEILLNGETFGRSSRCSISPRRIKSDTLLGGNAENSPKEPKGKFPRSLSALLKEAKIENHEEFPQTAKKIVWKKIFKNQKWTEDEEIATKYCSLFRICWHEQPSIRPEANQLLEELRDLARIATQ